MSNTIAYHHHARRELDRAIRRGYTDLADDPAARANFTELLATVRERSSLLRPRGSDVQRAAVRAIVNLARHHRDHLVDAGTWRGGEAGVHELVYSLAEHLLARYPVPRWFGGVWLGGDTALERDERRWFIEHAAGRRFRDIAGLPVPMTRRMEHILLTMPPQRSLRAAIRRAEILGLGGPPELADTLLQTDLGDDLEHAEFWRGAIHFFVNHHAALDGAQIKAIVDFLYAARIRSTEHATAGGLVVFPPPHPDFSLAGRTPQSIMRLVDAWHVELGSRKQSGRSWPASGMQWFNYLESPDEDPVHWRIEELLQSGDLYAEGRALGHCVASYEHRCLRGVSSIWSLRRRNREGAYIPRCTIEIDPRTRTVVQLRGQHNRHVIGLPRRIVERWAQRERLTVPVHA